MGNCAVSNIPDYRSNLTVTKPTNSEPTPYQLYRCKKSFDEVTNFMSTVENTVDPGSRMYTWRNNGDGSSYTNIITGERVTKPKLECG